MDVVRIRCQVCRRLLRTAQRTEHGTWILDSPFNGERGTYSSAATGGRRKRRARCNATDGQDDQNTAEAIEAERATGRAYSRVTLTCTGRSHATVRPVKMSTLDRWCDQAAGRAVPEVLV